MKKKKKDALTEYVKANRRGSREAEIEMYGHPVNYHRICVSKKVYDRKRMKAGDRRLPYFLFRFLFFSEKEAVYRPGIFLQCAACQEKKINLQIDC